MPIPEKKKQEIKDAIPKAINAISHIEEYVFQKDDPIVGGVKASKKLAAHIRLLVRHLEDVYKHYT